MNSNFLPTVSADELKAKLAANNPEEIFEFLAEPLHEELYRRQDFTYIDEFSDGQQLLVSYDYVRMQAMQGGFIQMIQNGYIGILPPMPGWLEEIGATEMSKTLDDVLKVYVLNRELLDKPTTVEEFAKLYEELKEFEILDDRFAEHNSETIRLVVEYAKGHIDDFVKTV